jgi:hypothetical protein
VARSLNGLSESELRNLRQLYGVTYYISDKRVLGAFREVYANAQYSVFSLDDMSSQQRR